MKPFVNVGANNFKSHTSACLLTPEPCLCHPINVNGVGVRTDDANRVGDSGRLLYAGVLLEDIEGGGEEGQIL